MIRIINRSKKLLKNKRGFTLLEVLVSIALLGIVLPLTFELFNLGANVMGKSKVMVENNYQVSYAMDTDGRTEGVLDSNTGVPSSGKITVNYNNLTGVNNEQYIYYTAKKKGEVVYYTYEP